MRKTTILLLALVLLLSVHNNAQAQSFGPRELAEWLKGFSYDQEKLEKATVCTPVANTAETIEKRSGICGDFAYLTGVYLQQMGYQPFILVYRRSPQDWHAVTVFEWPEWGGDVDKFGALWVFDNTALIGPFHSVGEIVLPTVRQIHYPVQRWICGQN